MLISHIKINNYRGLNIEIEGIKKVSIMIGKNDSGKTNICSAILKVLDFNKRRIPFIATDSTDSNKEKIEIEITLTADDLTLEQLALIGNYIYTDENGQKYITAKLSSIYNEETLEYEDTLEYGEISKDSKEVKPYTQTQLDKVLSIVYINPIYDINSSKTDFFKFKESENKEKGIYFSDNVKNELKNFNECIQKEEIINQIQDEINDQGDFKELLENLNFKVLPNIKEENIYRTLSVSAYDLNDNEYSNIGDGKNKIFSTILKSKIYNNDKKKIYIIEEPENHLYVLLQKMYLSALLNMNPDQLIVTTHSPYTIDFEKTNHIIKIVYDKNEKIRKIYDFNGISNDDFKKYGYLINVEIAEALYYDNVLLIEGDSEKYFYSFLMARDNQFLKKINEKKFGIFSVNGIAFKTTKELLEKLGINVFIKTDNDIFKVPHTNLYRYAGLERCIQYLSEDGKDKLKKLLGIENLEFRFENETNKMPLVEEKISEICDLLNNEHILFSEHNDGFERDLIEYLKLNPNNNVSDESISMLKKAKLKNLHYFINEYNLDIKVCTENKNSILVGFLYE